VANKKKEESTFVGERTTENFLATVAGAIEHTFGKECEVYPSLNAPQGVAFDGVEIKVAVEFRAGRPYVNIDNQDIVRGLSDINVAVKRTAEAAFHAMPKFRAEAARLAAVTAQAERIKEINALLGEGDYRPVHVSEQYAGGQLRNLRINAQGVASDTDVSDLDEKQLKKLLKLTKAWKKARDEFQEFFQTLKGKVETRDD
jgi:hypothetical protein